MGRIHLVSVHVVVPPESTVARSHTVATDLESEVANRLQDTYVQTPVEPSDETCRQPLP